MASKASTSGQGDLTSRLQKLAKSKQRTFETSRDIHLPFLKLSTSSIQAVLLGDSMLERMKTTALSEDGKPWPSAQCLSDDDLAPMDGTMASPSRLEGVFNAGVGGDKYENIIYRLAGNDGGDADTNLESLLEALRPQPIRLWVVHAGTNNLHPKRGLSDDAVQALRLILEAIISISASDVAILLPGLFYRKDIRSELIDEANTKLYAVVTELAASASPSINIRFLAPPSEIDLDRHLDDHVHLNADGYRIWMRTLLPVIHKAIKAE